MVTDNTNSCSKIDYTYFSDGRCPPSQQDRLEGSHDRKAKRAVARPRGRNGAGHHPDSVVQVNQPGDASR